MIKEIFLPEIFKNKRLISQRIIGLSIQEDIIRASQIYATSSITKIERLEEKPIPQGAPDRYSQRATEAVKNILSRLSKYNQIRISIPASIVTFKELILPFTDIEKIKMIIEYEVEPMLPFSMNEAIVDFIVTQKLPEQKATQVLVAAVRIQDLQNIFDIYKNANVEPNCITTDLFALYGLYLQIPEYKNLPHATALVDIGSTTTSIAFLLNSKLRLIRNIAKGTSTIAKHISQETNTPISTVLEKLKTFNLQQHSSDKFNQVTEKHLIHFFNDIQFTLNSFSLKLKFYQEIAKILFTGKELFINNLTRFSSNLLQISCEYFSCEKLLKTNLFKNKTKQIPDNWTKYAVALGTTLSYDPHKDFNLRQKSFAQQYNPLAVKQIITAAVLIFAIFAAICIRGYFQISNLTSIANTNEKNAISKLKKIFPPNSRSSKETNLKKIMKDAETTITEKQKAWAPFYQENLQPLEILLELCQVIDPRLFNITIENISIHPEEQGTPIIKFSGLFKSEPGKTFDDFEAFQKYFEQNCNILTFAKSEPTIKDFDEKTIHFEFTLKLKEK